MFSTCDTAFNSFGVGCPNSTPPHEVCVYVLKSHAKVRVYVRRDGCFLRVKDSRVCICTSEWVFSTYNGAFPLTNDLELLSII